MNTSEHPIWTDKGLAVPFHEDNATVPLDSAIESKVQMDVIAYRVAEYYKNHDEEIQNANPIEDEIGFALRMIGKAVGFISEAGCSTGHIHANTATEMQVISKVVWLTQQSSQCIIMAANTLINRKEQTELMNKKAHEMIESCVNAKEFAKVHPPIDYMDIGKKIGVSSTQGMELHAAVNQAYTEWKEKHGHDT